MAPYKKFESSVDWTDAFVQIYNSVRWSDVFVTLTVTGLGLYDFTRGVANYASPTEGLGALSGVESPDAYMLRIVRNGGVGLMEAGTGLVVVSLYRSLRWWRGRNFNPFGFVLMLTLDVVGLPLKLGVLLPASSADTSSLGTELVRGSLSLLAWTIACFWAYRKQIIEMIS